MNYRLISLMKFGNFFKSSYLKVRSNVILLITMTLTLYNRTLKN